MKGAQTLGHINHLESILGSAPLYMERRFFDRVAARFLTEMDLVAQGNTDVLEVVKDRRKSCEPSLLYSENGQTMTARFTGEEISARAGQFAHLKLSGTMMVEGFLSTRGVQDLANDIRIADQSPNIDGILIEANTGGGELLAGQVLRNAIKDAKKPVLVYAHYLASAGVWGTLFADHIMAAGKGSEVGSIGVYTAVNREFLQVYKERVQDIYSRKSPNKNKDFRSLLDGDASVLEDNVTEADEIFMADVRRNRPLAGDIDETLAGGMFFAADAKKRGLVDSIGTFGDAVAELSRLVRNQKNNTMSKTSFSALAKKFLGIETASEEEAVQALEAANLETEANEANEPSALETALEEVLSRVATLETSLAALSAHAETLAKDLSEIVVPTAEQIESKAAEVAAEKIEALRLEVAGEMNALKTSKAGAEAEGDEAPVLPKGGNKPEGPKVDLLTSVKGKSIEVVRGLN